MPVTAALAAYGDDLLRSVIRPHPLKSVKFTNFGAEQVDDDVIRVNQHPVGLPHAFQPQNLDTGLFQPVFEMFCHSRHLTRRAASGDDHMVGHRRFALQWNGNHVFSFIAIQGRGDQFQDLVGIRIRLQSANRLSPVLRPAAAPAAEPVAELLPTLGAGAQR